MLSKEAYNMGKHSEREPLATDTALLTLAPMEDAVADAESSTGKSPAFQFYPNDFLSDPNVIVMSMQERGVYITLLCICWTQGALPADTSRLARLCGTPFNTFRKLWPAIDVCFRPHPDDAMRLVHPRLERERRKQEAFKQEKSDAGKAGAKKRWHSDSSVMAAPSFANGTNPSLPMANDSSLSLSSSLSSSSDFSPQERVRADEPEIAIKPNGTKPSFFSSPSDFSQEENQRAGDFVERYADLHEKHRHGARYISKPNLDYLEALQLVRVWDDERLDKLAHAFLVTDDEWVASGSRTLARFRSRASWCDEQLRERGL